MHNCCIVLLGFERSAFVDCAGLSDCAGLCLAKPVDRQGPLTIWALMRLIWSASFGPCLCQRPSLDLTSTATDFDQLVASWLIFWALHINIYKLWHMYYKLVKHVLHLELFPVPLQHLFCEVFRRLQQYLPGDFDWEDVWSHCSWNLPEICSNDQWNLSPQHAFVCLCNMYALLWKRRHWRSYQVTCFRE